MTEPYDGRRLGRMVRCYLPSLINVNTVPYTPPFRLNIMTSHYHEPVDAYACFPFSPRSFQPLYIPSFILSFALPSFDQSFLLAYFFLAPIWQITKWHAWPGVLLPPPLPYSVCPVLVSFTLNSTPIGATSFSSPSFNFSPVFLFLSFSLPFYQSPSTRVYFQFETTPRTTYILSLGVLPFLLTAFDLLLHRRHPHGHLGHLLLASSSETLLLLFPRPGDEETRME